MNKITIVAVLVFGFLLLAGGTAVLLMKDRSGSASETNDRENSKEDDYIDNAFEELEGDEFENFDEESLTDTTSGTSTSPELLTYIDSVMSNIDSSIGSLNTTSDFGDFGNIQ